MLADHVASLGGVARREGDRDPIAARPSRQGGLDVDPRVSQAACRFGEAAGPIFERGRHDLDLAIRDVGRPKRSPRSLLIVRQERHAATAAAGHARERGDVDALRGNCLGNVRDGARSVLELDDEGIHRRLPWSSAHYRVTPDRRGR